jgi:chloramphenicol O-acetyltransferase
MIYCDDLIDYGWDNGSSCHLFADDISELHNFAREIGMKRVWFQNDTRLPHYDLTAKRRITAIKNGAKEVDRKFMRAFIRNYWKSTLEKRPVRSK